MRWTHATSLLLQLIHAGALPIPRAMVNEAFTSINVLKTDIETAYTKFELTPGAQDEQPSPGTALVFELQVDPSQKSPTSTVRLNSQPWDIQWIQPHQPDPAVLQVNTKQFTVPDQSGFLHSLSLSYIDQLATFAGIDRLVHSLHFHVDSIDGVSADLSFAILVQPSATPRLLQLTTATPTGIVSFDLSEKSHMKDVKVPLITVDDPPSYDEDAYNVEADIESLLLLEAEAGELQDAIAAKKEAIARCLKDHRDKAALKHLLSQCDGLVCAAKIIAQRICDKMGILMLPNVEYAKIHDHTSQTPISFHDEKTSNSSSAHMIPEKRPGTTQANNIHTAAAIQSVRLVYPQNVLFKVLAVIATALGLTALFQFIRRKCMSARRKAERAADAEERRNARAYRRAARRAEMRRRWDDFVSAINCFRAAPESNNLDYEEKRALIVQDAFLEQEAGAAEKGEIMEAEIRELRHAHEIVASLIRVDENRYDLVTPLRDPPPPMVPLPYTPASRSRASSATLPSYTSEILPDYTSRYTRTEASSNGSSSSSIRSSNSSIRSSGLVVDGFDLYSPTTVSQDGDGCTQRSRSPESSNGSTRPSRYTPTSSVRDTSPRPSAETLRTTSRFSRDMTGRSL